MPVLKIKKADGTWQEVWGAVTDTPVGGMVEQVQADWDETDTTSPAYIKNKPIISSGDGGVSIQANWAQNDETAVDYIKNKPFGEYEGVVDILSTTQYDGFYFDEGYGVHMKDVEAAYELTVGETYTVYWDGNEYSCVAQDASAVMSGVIALGNCAPFGLSGNNEPFIIATLPNGYVAYMSLTDTEAGGSHTIGITQKEGEIVNQIDPKYIPIPYFGDGGTKQTELIPTTDLTLSYFAEAGLYNHDFTPSTEQLAAWQSDWTTADVVWDGTTYTCEPQNVQGVKCVGNVDFMMDIGDNGMPFVLLMSDVETFGQDICIIYSIVDFPTDVNNAPDITHNISVLTNTTNIVTIDPKYIKNVSWDKIADKPFETIAAGTVVLNEDVIANDNFNILKNLAHEYMIAGGTYTVTVGDYTYNAICEENDELKEIYVYDYDNDIEAVGIAYLEGMSTCVLNTNIFSSGSTYNVKVIVSEDIVKTIDPKYIPEIDGLPEVTTSDNGKTLLVSDGTWSVAEPVKGVPEVTTSDNGKFLRVVDGAWVAVAVENAEEVAF